MTYTITTNRPALTGSAKQINWANDIRNNYVAAVESKLNAYNCDDADLKDCVKYVATTYVNAVITLVTSSRCWIEGDSYADDSNTSHTLPFCGGMYGKGLSINLNRIAKMVAGCCSKQGMTYKAFAAKLEGCKEVQRYVVASRATVGGVLPQIRAIAR